MEKLLNLNYFVSLPFAVLKAVLFLDMYAFFDAKYIFTFNNIKLKDMVTFYFNLNG